MRSAAAAPPGGGAPLEGKHINVQPTIKNQVLTWSRDLTSQMRTYTEILKGLVVALSVAAWSVSAADYTWTGTTSASWNTTDANWSGAGTV